MRSKCALVVYLMMFAIPCHAADADSRDVSFMYPGERLASDEMRVTIMGSASEARPAQAGSSIYVELGNGDSFIFDLGPGSAANYNAMGIPFSRMTRIFLTHLHVDHFSDLVYVYGFGAAYRRVEPVHVWGPQSVRPEYGIAAAMDGLKKMTEWHRKTFNILPLGRGYDLVVHEVDYRKNPSVVYQANGVTISAFPEVHVMDGPVGYRLDWNGLSFVYSGDTLPNRFLVENSKGVDLLLHEGDGPASVWTEKWGTPLKQNETIIRSAHTTPEGLGKVLSMTNPRMAVLTHVAVNEDTRIAHLDGIRKYYAGPIRIAEDLMVFNVTKAGVKQRMGVAPARPWWKTEPPAEAPPPAREKKENLLSDWLKQGEIVDY